MRGGYTRHWLRLVGRVVLLALLFSAANEALQLYTVDRVASLIDIVSAVIGAFIGGVGTSIVASSRDVTASRDPR